MINLNDENSEIVIAMHLNPTHLGRTAYVSSKSGLNTILGELRGIQFLNYYVSGKNGPEFDSILTVGDITVPVESTSSVYLVK